MNTFSIDAAALVEIQRIVRESVCIDPVAALLEMADPGDLLDDLKAAVLAGIDQKDLAEMGKKRIKEVEYQLTYFLNISTYERKDCQPEDLVKINGITFVMARYIFDALRDYCLTFETGHFMLRSADHVASNLRSIKLFNV